MSSISLSHSSWLEPTHFCLSKVIFSLSVRARFRISATSDESGEYFIVDFSNFGTNASTGRFCSTIFARCTISLFLSVFALLFLLKNTNNPAQITRPRMTDSTECATLYFFTTIFKNEAEKKKKNLIRVLVQMALQELQKEVQDAVSKYAKTLSSSGLSASSNEDGFNETFSMGKYKGKTIYDVVRSDISYIGWILNNKEINTHEDGGSMERVKFLIKEKLKN